MATPWRFPRCCARPISNVEECLEFSYWKSLGTGASATASRNFNAVSTAATSQRRNIMAKKFNITIKQLPQVAYPIDKGFILRKHQQTEYDSRTYQLRAFIAAGGSGKTVTQEACAVKEMRESGFTQRQLISASQSQICKQFATKTLLRLDCTAACFDAKGKIWTCNHNVTTWHVRPDFNLADYASKNVIDRLEAFIMRTPRQQESVAKKLKATGVFTGLTVITTHAAITRVFTERILPKVKSGQYSAQRVRDAVNNLTNRTDESHHVGGLTDKETEEQNGLGRFLSFCHQRGNSTSRIFLTTATPYREQCEMVGGRLFKKFKVRVLPLSVWAQYLGIKHIVITLEEYDGKNPIASVAKNIGREKGEKHLVVSARENEKWMIDMHGEKGEKKTNAVAKYIRAIRSVWPTAVIVDTISPKGRHIIKQELIDNPNAADVVLTCMMVREGVDVPAISRIHHTAMEQSKWLAVQTLYRAMRAYPDKDTVEIRYYVPRLKEMSRIKTREEFSDRVNLTLMLADLRDLADPLLALADIKTLGKYRKEFPKEITKVGLDDLFTVLNVNGMDIKKDVYVKLDALQNKTKAVMMSVIADVLTDAGVSKKDVVALSLDVYILADYILNLEEPENNPSAAKRIHKLKFDLALDPLEYIRERFDGIKDRGVGAFSGSYSPKDLETLRKFFLGWSDVICSIIKKKLLKASHLTRQERYYVLTPQEQKWLKYQNREGGL
jgi:hypothetical protein